MDGLNQWHAHPDPEDELAYMYQRQEEYAMMQGMQQQYTLPPAMAPPPIAGPSSSRPPHPRHSSTSFRGGFGVPPALPSLPFGEVAVKNDPGQPSSSSHRILSFGGQLPGTIDISGGDWPDGIEAALQLPAPERRSRAHFWNTQKQHVVAERKRREKMQQQFVALATIVPDLTKPTVGRGHAAPARRRAWVAWPLAARCGRIIWSSEEPGAGGRETKASPDRDNPSTIEYVKQLEEKVKTLKGRSARRRMSKPTVFESKYRISTDGSDTSGSSESAFSAGGFSPTVEARIHGDTVLLRIWCKDRKGVLVMLISELEKQGLSIINTSVLPFTDSCLNITITAKASILSPD
uniref:BHLH domain-containing protein n=1 Tax=Setaria italica TaxID=4555 RepID=K3ZEU0_SETIT